MFFSLKKIGCYVIFIIEGGIFKKNWNTAYGTVFLHDQE